MQHQAPTNAPDDLLGLTGPVGLKRIGRETRMLVENADDRTAADPSLLRIMARGHHIQARLIHNHQADRSRGGSVGSLPLYPSASSLAGAEITTAIINGRKPPQLTAQRLMGLTPRLPAGWAERESCSAFAENKSSILRVPASNHFGFA